MQKTEDVIKLTEDAIKRSEYLFFERKFGSSRVQKELGKQFPSDVVEKAVKHLNPGFEERHMKQIILGKFGRRLFVDHEKEKIVRMLVRLGYTEEQATNILEVLEQEEF